jgi:hypothetical protein
MFALGVGEKKFGEHDAESVGIGRGEIGEGATKNVFGVRTAILRGKESGREGGTACGVGGRHVRRQGVEGALPIVATTGGKRAFAEDEYFFACGGVVGNFFAEFGHAGHVTGAGGVEGDTVGHALVAEGHERGLPQEGGGFRDFAPIDCFACALGNGESAAGFEFAVDRLCREGGGYDKDYEAKENDEAASADPTPPTDGLMLVVERVAGQLGLSFGSWVVFWRDHEEGNLATD